MTTTTNTQITTIVDGTTAIISELLTSALGKSPKALQSLLALIKRDSTQKRLTELVKTNLPVKLMTTTISPPKDENAPQRPPSAWLLFRSETLAKLRKDRGDDFDYKEHKDEISRAWESLKETTEHAKWQQKADALKAKYKEECDKYEGSEDWKAYQEILADFKANPTKYATKPKRTRGSTKTAKPRDSKKPSRPLNAYFRWTRDNREAIKQEFQEENPDLAGKEFNKAFAQRLAEVWNQETTEDEKRPYVDAASKDLETYHKELDAYTVSTSFKTNHPELAAKEQELVRKRKMRAEKVKDGKPKNPKTAYSFFQEEKTKELAAEIPDGKERRARVSELWKTEFKSAESRRPWTLLAAKDKLRYNKQLVKWARSQSIPDTVDEEPAKKKVSFAKTTKAAAQVEEDDDQAGSDDELLIFSDSEEE